MKSKMFSSVGLFLLIVLLSIPFYLLGENEKQVKVKDGLYMGKFHDNAMFYESDSGKIKKIGPSFAIRELIGVDDESFFSYISENYFEKYIYCQKLPITKNDYGKTIIGSNEEFLGLFSGPLLRDADYEEGILVAIKDLPDGKFLITLFNLSEEKTFQTTGKVCQIEKPVPHRKLSFVVNDEINNFENELWEITLNPITNYEWKGIFNVYINGFWRFEIEVIDN